MKFAVGYQLPEEDEEPLVDIVAEFGERIDEVYFPWPHMPTGRSPMGSRDGAVDWEAQARLEADLAAIRHCHRLPIYQLMTPGSRRDIQRLSLLW